MKRHCANIGGENIQKIRPFLTFKNFYKAYTVKTPLTLFRRIFVRNVIKTCNNY